MAQKKKTTTKKAATKRGTKKTTSSVKATAKSARKATKKPAKRTTKPKANKAQSQASSTSWKDFTHEFPSFNTMFKTPMEDMMSKGPTQYDQIAKDAADTSREGFEAMVQSANIFTKGFEELFRASISLAQNSAEKQADFVKKAMGTKSINDFATMQNAVTKENYEAFVAEATKLSELSVKTLTEAAEPIQAQINKAVQKASKMAA